MKPNQKSTAQHRNMTTSTGPTYYNNGMGTSPLPIFSITNYFPVVTYDDNYPSNNGIWIGWTFDNSSGSFGGTGAIDAVYPIVLKCDGYGVPLSGTSYWQVPTALYASSQDSVAFLSLSGRDASDKLFLTYDAAIVNNIAVHDIVTKEVTSVSGVSNLRTESVNNANTLLANNFNSFFAAFNNSDSLFSLKLYDLSGKVIVEERGCMDKIRNVIKQDVENIPASIYLARIISNDGTVNISRKFFLTQ